MSSNLDSFYNKHAKRWCDAVAGAALLTATAPVLAACAVAIKLDDGGPVFFHQLRAGKDGQQFTVHKLRTMTVGTDKIDGGYPTPAMVTKVGGWLRRLSLDEIPQLWNITVGEMSFVGPRPTVPDQVARYTERQFHRLYVRPGLTGVWRQDTSAAAEPRSKLSRAALRWGLEALVVQHLSMTRIAEGLDVAWNTANDAVLAEGQRVLISDPTRFDDVRVIGVDEHCWRHTRRGEKYVTVIIDLTPSRDGTGPARLLDMVEGRSKQVFKTWLNNRTQAWRDGIEVVAMDGFTGYKTAAVEELHHATAVMDPFHVVRLAGEALTRCRQRVQQDTCGHRGRSGDPLYRARRTLLTGVDLLTDRQVARLEALFADEQHAEVHATWSIYQRLVVAYRQPDKQLGRFLLEGVIDAIRTGVPKELVELVSLGRTLHRRSADVLAFFALPGTSNGPTEAINGRLEHLRGIALGFRNLTHYIARSLLETGGFKPRLHPRL